MPISQLLASITGEKPTPPSAAPPSRSSNGPTAKRKADEDGDKGSAHKANKTTSALTDPASKAPRPPSTGYAGSARPSSSTLTPRSRGEKSFSLASKKSFLGSNSNGKSSPTTGSFSSAVRGISTSAPLGGPLAKKPAPSMSNPQSSDPGGKAPKKGSIAEIRARAAAQQAKLHAIGKIQHKATEKPLTKKEREEAAAEELKASKKGLKHGMKPGMTGVSSRNGPSGLQRSGAGGHLDRNRGAIQKPGKAAAVVEERKVRKAAAATTGYTGSARPPPSKANKVGPISSKPGVSGAGRGELGREKRPNPMGMFSKPRVRRDEDYDEDMEDFVVDDEEEEDDGYGYATRYRYADEDDESDMEAGYSDVADEETQAERLARLEDEREQAILERRKREKEARKRGLAGR